jgi:UDP-3-O-[3-hydroxymyristoyl] glucosamine N-acyltransferase
MIRQWAMGNGKWAIEMTTLSKIAQLLNVAAPAGSDDVPINGLAMLHAAREDDLSFLGSDRFLAQFSTTRAAAVLVQKRIKLPADVKTRVLVVDDADLAMAKVLELFSPEVPRPAAGVDCSARVAKSATIGKDCSIGANVVISENAKLGARCIVHANAVIGDEVVIGDDCELFPGVVIRERCTLGNRVIIHANSVIGTDGFGYRWDGTKHAKVPHIGTVIIDDDVEIGSCTCVDRAKFSATRVGKGTKIDNLVQVGHNVVIGPHCILCGQAGLAGSVVLGAGVVLGGQSAVRDHIQMGDGSMLAACSGVMDDVDPKAIVSGLPALPHRQSLREQAALRRLPDLVAQVRKLQEEIEELKKATT